MVAVRGVFRTTGGTKKYLAEGDMVEFLLPPAADGSFQDVAITLRALLSCIAPGVAVPQVIGVQDWRFFGASSTGAALIGVSGATNVGTGFIWISNDSGSNWTVRDPGPFDWRGCAISSDGTKLAACSDLSGAIWLSADSGATWAEQLTPGVREWCAVTMSADGAVIRALAEDGTLWGSDNSGSSWAAQTAIPPGSGLQSGLACDSSGLILLGTDNTGNNLLVSTNGGTSWSTFDAGDPGLWTSFAMSSNGVRMHAGAASGFSNSADSGATWTFVPWGRSATGIASAADGQTVYGQDLAASTTGIHGSTDAEATRTDLYDAVGHALGGLACDADGSVVVTGDRDTGDVIVSVNSGVTWTPVPVP